MVLAGYILLFMLFLIASFGVGFIMNMLVKRRPWTSTVIAVALAAFFVFRLQTVPTIVISTLPVLIGGIAATFTIKTLQARGFKMFG